MMMMIDDGKDGGHHADKGGGHDVMVDTMIRKMANEMIRTMVDKIKRASVVDFFCESACNLELSERFASFVQPGGHLEGGGQGLSGRRHLLI